MKAGLWFLSSIVVLLTVFGTDAEGGRLVRDLAAMSCNAITVE
jgi:hypothetical protein